MTLSQTSLVSEYQLDIVSLISIPIAPCRSGDIKLVRLLTILCCTLLTIFSFQDYEAEFELPQSPIVSIHETAIIVICAMFEEPLLLGKIIEFENLKYALLFRSPISKGPAHLGRVLVLRRAPLTTELSQTLMRHQLRALVLQVL